MTTISATSLLVANITSMEGLYTNGLGPQQAIRAQKLKLKILEVENRRQELFMQKELHAAER